MKTSLPELERLAARYRATGRIAFVYPRKHRVSLNGGASIPFKQAAEVMQRAVESHFSGAIARGTHAELWRVGDVVYRRSIGPYAQSTSGLPMDLRWECSYSHFQHYRTTAYEWAVDLLTP